MEIEISKIRIDGGTQPREMIDQGMVAEYASAMEEGAKFPPIVVFFDGVTHWLADGFHRYHGANKVGFKTISAEVRNGTQRDAVLFSVSANATHGQRRTNADKRKAVLTLLQDEEWANWSDSEIARKTNTTHPFVAKVREETTSILKPLQDTPATRTVTRQGVTYQQNTANIGRKREIKEEAKEEKPQRVHNILNKQKEENSLADADALFVDAYKAMHRALLNARALRWETTTRATAQKHLEILMDLTREG